MRRPKFIYILCWVGRCDVSYTRIFFTKADALSAVVSCSSDDAKHGHYELRRHVLYDVRDSAPHEDFEEVYERFWYNRHFLWVYFDLFSYKDFPVKVRYYNERG